MNLSKKAGAGLLLLSLAVGAVWVGRRTPRLSEGTPSYRQKGPAEAPVVLVEYSDFQCPKCAQAQPVLRDLLNRYEGRVRLVFRHCPLPSHAWASLAARAAEAAGRQNKFWEYADVLYSRQAVWSAAPDPRALFDTYARELGLDEARWKKDVDDPAVEKIVKDERARAEQVPISATPTFFINEKIIVGDSQLEAVGVRFMEQELRP